MAYWDHWKHSSYNGKVGSWVSYGGQVFWPANAPPSYPGGPPIPPPGSRS
jgi:hypothetical protein